MSEVQVVEPKAETAPETSCMPSLDARVWEAVKQSPAFKALKAELEELRKAQQKQAEDHKKVWNWVRALEQRLLRVERHEAPAKEEKKD